MQFNPKFQINPEIEQFVKLVEQMRTSQKNYFQYRSSTELNKCKKLERQVDKAIEQLTTKHKQLSLTDKT